MARIATFQAALDEIYRTFMRVKDEVKLLHDRDSRQPQRLIDIARALDLVPDPARVIRVTGSKGKGTAARAAAAYLRANTSGERVALFVSPEEIDHNDRMRIDGQAIDRGEFVRILNELMPALTAAEFRLGPAQYLSPLGIFLLIALKWFKEQDAKWFVLETGRGVRYDEVGQLDSRVSIVTSVLLEHAAKIGPTLDDIARDKLSIVTNSEFVIVPEEVAALNARLGVAPPEHVCFVASGVVEAGCPAWLTLDLALAREAVAGLLGWPPADLRDIDAGNVSAAFVSGVFHGVPFVAEALIHLASFDRGYVERLAATHGRFLAICSFPDDKDRERLVDALAAAGGHVVETVLEGTRGYLDYAQSIADQRHSKIICGYEDADTFWRSVSEVIAATRPGFVYFAGTQTFLRLVRRAFPGTGSHSIL